MFGKRTGNTQQVIRATGTDAAFSPSSLELPPRPVSDLLKPATPGPQSTAAAAMPERGENDQIRAMLFSALIETIDLTRLAHVCVAGIREFLRRGHNGGFGFQNAFELRHHVSER